MLKGIQKVGERNVLFGIQIFFNYDIILVRYLDKEAGVMVEKLLNSNEKPGSDGQANGAVKDMSENSTAKSTDLAVENESMVYYLGRKFFEVNHIHCLWNFLSNFNLFPG